MSKNYTKQDMLDCMQNMLDKSDEFENYFGVVVRNKNYKTPELIMNELASVEDKMKYYASAYTEDLVLKSCSDIEIIGWCVGDSVAIAMWFEQDYIIG